MNQMNMFLKDGTTQQYIEDTLEPIPSRSLFRNDQYFFYLCMMQKYARESCPSYLTEEGFKILKVNLHIKIYQHHFSRTNIVLKSGNKCHRCL
jgi:betaine lipid synthase